ncbi:ABC transporter permease subunit [Ornithinibacillus gellani]
MSALLEVEPDLIEAYTVIGFKRRLIIWHVLLRKASPLIILGLTIQFE